MENQNSQSDPPKNAMPNSSSQPKDDQSNEAGFTSDQSAESDLIRMLIWPPDIMQNNLESIFEADTTAEATANPSSSAEPQNGQSHSQRGNESGLFGEPKWKPVPIEFNASTSQQVDKMALQMFVLTSVLSTDQSLQHQSQAPIVERPSSRNNTLVSSGQQEPRLYTFPKPANADRVEAPKKFQIDGPCEPDAMIITNPNGNQHSPAKNKPTKPADTPRNAVQAASPALLNSAITDTASSSDRTKLLWEHIKSINSTLVDTKLVLVPDKDGNAADSKGRHAVLCIHNDSSLKMPRSIIPDLKLRLLVPVDYPMDSPNIMNFTTNSPSWWTNSDDLHMKAHSRLPKRCYTLENPISLEEFAKAWDASARAVVLEYISGWTDRR